MDKLLDLLKNDKVLHALIGVATLVGLGAVFAVDAAFGFYPAASLATSLTGAAIEGYQKLRGGDVSLLDGLATAAPGPALWGAMSIF